MVKRKYAAVAECAAVSERGLPPLQLWEAALFVREHRSTATKFHRFRKTVIVNDPVAEQWAPLTKTGFDIERDENARSVRLREWPRKKRARVDTGKRGVAFTAKTNASGDMFKTPNERTDTPSALSINADRRVFNVCLWAVFEEMCSGDDERALRATVRDVERQPPAFATKRASARGVAYPDHLFDEHPSYTKRLTENRVVKIVRQFMAEYGDKMRPKLVAANLVTDDGTVADRTMGAYVTKLRPTATQRRTLERQVRASNHVYNWCLWLTQNGYCCDTRGLPNVVSLQRIVAPAKRKDDNDAYTPSRIAGFTASKHCEFDASLFDSDDDWFYDNVANVVKVCAVRDFVVSYNKTNAAVVAVAAKKKTVVDDEIHHRCRPVPLRHDVPVVAGGFAVPKLYGRLPTDKERREYRAIADKCIAIIPSVLNGGDRALGRNSLMRISCRGDRLPPFLHEFRITRQPDGSFRMTIPCLASRLRKPASSSDAVCAIDPGVRTFATVYDATRRECWETGTASERTNLLAVPFTWREDEIREQLAAAVLGSQERENRRRQLRKLLARRRVTVDEFHKQLTIYLVRNYGVVAVGDYSHCGSAATSNTIGRSTKRWAAIWSHSRFRTRLVNRAKGTACEVIVQKEHYTSKACGRCGTCNKNLGGLETYTCIDVECGYVAERDVNGARNILRKAMGIDIKTAAGA